MKKTIAELLNKITPWCWPDLVSFFMGYISFRELIGKRKEYEGCIQDSIEDGACYCGKFVEGKRYCGERAETTEEVNIEKPF